jgi:ribonuclease J
MSKDQYGYLNTGLHFLPLGGSEQFGLNFNLYACDGQFILFDCGLGFADHRFPNVDVLLPDPEFVERIKDRLVGLVITHAHEDHIGAVPYLWPRLQCPIYCSNFTATVLKQKFDDYPKCKGAKIHIVNEQSQISLGAFDLRFLPVSHSIPEALATEIQTAYGSVVHSGDWNLDPYPVLGTPTSEEKFRALGQKNILAYVGDSTNSPIEGRGKSEIEVEQGLADLFASVEGRLVVTIFASNIARIRSICLAAKQANRSVGVLGRSLHKMIGSAKNCGYLKDIPDFVSEDDMAYVPRHKQVFIVTGSQGEPMAAMARLAKGDWPGLRLSPQDTVIFSSRAIPGNEVEINTVKNNLAASGIQVIDPSNTRHLIHASGHPYRDEVQDMLSWVKPQIVIPVHGERLMLEAQAQLARDMQIAHVLVPNNGSVIHLAPNKPEIVDHVETGLLAVEPQRIVKSNHKSISERRKLQYSGAVHITLLLDRKGNLATKPQMTLIGLIDEDDKRERDVLKDLTQEIEDTILDLQDEQIFDTSDIEEDVRIAVRRLLHQIFGFKPKVTIHALKV